MLRNPLRQGMGPEYLALTGMHVIMHAAELRGRTVQCVHFAD